VPALRLVVDTNVLLRGLLNQNSTAGKVVRACDDRRAVILLSKRLHSEYRAVLTDPAVTIRYPELTTERVEIALRRLRYVADDLGAVRVRFEYPRDPKDAMLVELAIAGRATHILSADKDVLSLANGHDEAAKRFRQRAPRVSVLDPVAFVKVYGDALGI
jgi:putative PIN family toxin of toxin-antitoxin system